MSKTQKGRPASAKKVKNRVVTIMLSFQKREWKICDDNFFSEIQFFFKRI